jgi:hypothetical protein
MTVAAGKTPYHSYSPGSAMAAEAIPFDFGSHDHLLVGVVGGAPLAYGSDYSIAGDHAGGTATITALVDAGSDVWELWSETPREQQLDLRESRLMPLPQYMLELDRRARIERELAFDLSRTLLFPRGETPPTVPALADRTPGYFVGIDADGNLTALQGGGADDELRGDLAAVGGAALVGFLQAGTGAVARSVRARLRDTVNVRDFGAVGDIATDDTAAIQAAIDHCLAVRGTLHFPAPAPGEFYKITSPLVLDAPLRMMGAGEHSTTIVAVGFSAGEHIFDFDCAVPDVVEHIEISGMSLRSLDGVPSGIRFENASYAVLREVRLYNLVDGVTIDGTRCFSHAYDQVRGHEIGRATVSFAPTYAGGGHFVFKGCTFTGDIGVVLSTGCFVDNLCFTGCNWEQCESHGLSIEGTVAGLSVVGSRTEGCDGPDFMIRPGAADEYVGGLLIAGNSFSASDSSDTDRIVLGGSLGKVRGLQISGNLVTHGSDEFGGKLVQFNGDGGSGAIFGNFIRGVTADGAGVISAPRAGVKVFANENLTGDLGESDGAARIFATATIALAAGAVNAMQVTITARDAAGVAITGVQALDVWVSEAASGIGLTADAYSGDLVVTTGSELQEIVSKKHYTLLTDANGVIVLTITDTAEPADQYMVVRHPVTGRPIVSAASGASWG